MVDSELSIYDPEAGASFRDPDGFVYRHEGVIFRQINAAYEPAYEQLMSSGLYKTLVKHGLLLAHTECGLDKARNNKAWKVICPEQLTYVSYPYEWCFSQLQDAALATLKIQQYAMQAGMTLKDANGFNIQFHKGKACLIDTLSFEMRKDGEPWAAYRQFCQHFLAPLLLMAYRDHSLVKLLRVHIDGVPLPLASSLLPKRSWLRYSVLSHIHLHARAQARFAEADSSRNRATPTVSETGLLGMLDSLQSLIKGLKWKAAPTEWGDYYADTNYDDAAMAEKREQIASLLSHSTLSNHLSKSLFHVTDIGGNTGRFSRVAAELGHNVVCQDIDELAIERNYHQVKTANETNLLPLVQDLSNPSPRLGWAHEERMSMLDRGPFDVAMALALIHHLAIANNTPLEKCAEFFATLCEFLIIEFVPKSDSQVVRLLSSREDIFPDYTFEGFERAFAKCFDTVKTIDITGSERRLYLLQRKLS